jgi:SAM-dependent methyltransferase
MACAPDVAAQMLRLGLMDSSGALTRLGASLAYDSLEYRWQQNYDPLEGMVDTSTLGAHPRVLDIGCGAGQTLRLLDLPPSAEPELVGLDLKSEALAYGASLTQGTSCSVLFCRASALNMPLPSGYFDLVICRGVLNYVPPRPLLIEATRVVRPGGLMYFRVETAWWDLRVLVCHRRLRDRVFALRDAAWGIAFGLPLLAVPPGGKLRGSRRFTTARRLRHYVAGTNCEILRYQTSKHGPQVKHWGTQATLLCRRTP